MAGAPPSALDAPTVADSSGREIAREPGAVLHEGWLRHQRNQRFVRIGYPSTLTWFKKPPGPSLDGSSGVTKKSSEREDDRSNSSSGSTSSVASKDSDGKFSGQCCRTLDLSWYSLAIVPGGTHLVLRPDGFHAQEHKCKDISFVVRSPAELDMWTGQMQRARARVRRNDGSRRDVGEESDLWKAGWVTHEGKKVYLVVRGAAMRWYKKQVWGGSAFALDTEHSIPWLGKASFTERMTVERCPSPEAGKPSSPRRPRAMFWLRPDAEDTSAIRKRSGSFATGLRPVVKSQSTSKALLFDCHLGEADADEWVDACRRAKGMLLGGEAAAKPSDPGERTAWNSAAQLPPVALLKAADASPSPDKHRTEYGAMQAPPNALFGTSPGGSLPAGSMPARNLSSLTAGSSDTDYGPIDQGPAAGSGGSSMSPKVGGSDYGPIDDQQPPRRLTGTVPGGLARTVSYGPIDTRPDSYGPIDTGRDSYGPIEVSGSGPPNPQSLGQRGGFQGVATGNLKVGGADDYGAIGDLGSDSPSGMSPQQARPGPPRSADYGGLPRPPANDDDDSYGGLSGPDDDDSYGGLSGPDDDDEYGGLS